MNILVLIHHLPNYQSSMCPSWRGSQEKAKQKRIQSQRDKNPSSMNPVASKDNVRQRKKESERLLIDKWHKNKIPS